MKFETAWMPVRCEPNVFSTKLPDGAGFLGTSAAGGAAILIPTAKLAREFSEKHPGWEWSIVTPRPGTPPLFPPDA